MSHNSVQLSPPDWRPWSTSRARAVMILRKPLHAARIYRSPQPESEMKIIPQRTIANTQNGSLSSNDGVVEIEKEEKANLRSQEPRGTLDYFHGLCSFQLSSHHLLRPFNYRSAE
ncbi:hypothetical protein NDU88_001775 [Pleurodeles waltl]|uniref:Uncharacterized protein n=1 Tax=Pleurodeles waltl TaxID=8319 RepID=A0AAV7U9E5_PLEWA|nr:hypothetical protein NDU88_001775 [Pleurodeles waltl]